MNSETSDTRLQKIEEEKETWFRIICKWNNLGPYDPIPAFTKEYAEKMIQKLDDEIGFDSSDV